MNAVNPTVVFTEMGRKAWSDSQKSAPMLQRIPLGKFAGTREREGKDAEVRYSNKNGLGPKDTFHAAVHVFKTPVAASQGSIL